MSRADALARAAVTNRGVACRAWHAVLALVITASLITQIVLLVHVTAFICHVGYEVSGTLAP
jgi:hypothetical protein